MPLEIGLIGATQLADRTLLQQGAHVRAVAASDPVQAKEYADQHRIPVVHETYPELLADPAIDAVYISLHNSAHHRWAVRAAIAGKHVIVEKPLCLTADEVDELAFAAADVKVFEAVATADHPWQRTVQEFIDEEPYGSLLSATTRLILAAPTGGGYRDRELGSGRPAPTATSRAPERGGGIFFEVASEWLQAVQATIGLTSVVAAEGRSDFDGPDGVDRSFEASLRWATGVTATLVADAGDEPRSEHVFTFERATVQLRDFLRPLAGAAPLDLIVTPVDGEPHAISFPPIAYYERQFARILDTPGDDLATAVPRITLMDEIYADALRRRTAARPGEGTP